MTLISGKLEDMKSMPWPVAVVVSISIIVIGVLAGMGKDTTTVLGAIILLLGAFGYAELREIKSNTNGNISKLMEELSEHRRADARNLQQAMENPAVPVKEVVPLLTKEPPSDGHS